MTLPKKQILSGLGIYFGLRIFSYFFSPGTPLYAANPVNWIMSASILLLTAYFLLRGDDRGWLIIAGEMILGGAGSFLEIKGISLRTLLLVFSMAIFVYQQYPSLYPSPKRGWARGGVLYLIAFILVIAGISAIRGYYLGHNIKLILADTIPYLFFLYYIPLKQLLLSEKFRQTSLAMLIAAIVGNFIFIYFTLTGFSSGIFVLQDSYYHWFRDVAAGKITDYGTGFFRILTNEQLLIVPLFLWLFSNVIARRPQNAADAAIPKNNGIASASNLAMTGALLAILTINITRIYLVALAVGILFLFSLKNWKRWLAYSAGALIFFVMAFTLTHLAATKGKSLGWEYLGLRLQSIAMPQIEDSSLSRTMLLPKILEKIKLHPLLGNGLGDTVTVFSPVFDTNITTPHFDWGYLEIAAEMGLLGLIAWLALMAYGLWLMAKQKAALAVIVALLVINITSPALFHVLGIVLITYMLASSLAQKSQLN